jgi:hypothetical protein
MAGAERRTDATEADDSSLLARELVERVLASRAGVEDADRRTLSK